MLTGNVEQATADTHFWHNESMHGCHNHAASINCRGFGGGLRPRWGARGAEPARMRESAHAASAARSARAKPARIHHHWKERIGYRLVNLKLEHVKRRTTHQPNRRVRIIMFALLMLLSS